MLSLDSCHNQSNVIHIGIELTQLVDNYATNCQIQDISYYKLHFLLYVILASRVGSSYHSKHLFSGYFYNGASFQNIRVLVSCVYICLTR